MNQELSANTQLSHYRIVEKLGAGGMGEVWLAYDERLKRKVALKLLPAELTADAERVRRFEQEAQAASALSHPNIISVYDIGECEAGRFIVMELVAGQTFRTLIAQNHSAETLLALGQQMAKALSAAHAAGITHRDIKPDNLMVRDDGYVKVLDFGLARLRPATESDAEAATLAQQTTPGTIMGTVAYMSPEQARGETVSHPSDVFALGIVLYELATGRHPFKAETLVGYLHAITLQTPAPPQQWQPKLPAALNDLLLRMLDKDASQRPTASEIAQTLQEIERARERATERRSDSATLILSPTAAPSIPSVPSTPIRHTVGREHERHELRAAFKAANDGRGSLLCVAGEPGIGKTTLVEDFLTELTTANSCTVARGRCSERLAGTEAYLPLLEALESLLQSDKRLAQTMKQLAPTWYVQVVPLAGDSEEAARLLAEVKAASQERMKRELANFLQAVAQAQPLVIFFDDLHWADVSTIDLLSFLAGKFAALRVLIVVTYRPSDMLLAKHPFLQIKPDLQARGVCRELSLEFLTEAEIADYLTLEFPRHAFPPDFAQLIHAKTEGSPLFMADLVRYLRDRGVIAKSGADFSLRSRRMDFSPSETESARTEVDDTSSQTEVRATWTLAQTLPDIERALPESVRGMIERKIAQLSEDDHKLLTCASVQGYEFDSAVVAQVLKLDADEVEERLEKLERVFAFVKLMSEAEFPNRTLTLKYRFVHVFYQNALYAGLRATRKATLSRDVALALEACYGARSASVANELALLWEAARDSARAADYFLQAAEHSSQVFAVQEAVDLARRGLAMIEKLPDDAERQAKELPLQIILANTLIATQGYAAPEVEQAYLRGRVLCRSLGEAVDALPVLGGVSLIFAVKGQLKASRELAEEFLEIAKRKRDPAELFGRQMLALFYFYTGDITQACQRYQECAQAYEPKRHRHLTWVYGDDVGMSSNAYLSWARWISGYPEQAWRDTEEALRLGQEVTQANSHAFSLHAKAFHYQCCRKRQEARLWAEKLIAFSEEYGLRYWSALGNLIRGWALVEQGLADEGIEESRAGIAVCKASGMELTQTIMLAILAESYVKAQRTEEGLQTLNQAFAVVAKTNEHVYEAELWRLKGELFLQTEADNRETEAEGFYLQAIVTAQHQKAKSLELRAATSLARLWQRQGKHEEARQMLAEIYGWFTEGFDTADLQEARALLEELQTQT